MPLPHADRTRFSSVKPDFKPDYAHGKSEPGAFLHEAFWRTMVIFNSLL
ncbi:MAG TPA: hypothetical protein VF026_24460 [Ktedonobacteraceae bacterium]